jgi:dTDP-4-dehydrorhamnose reductase
VPARMIITGGTGLLGSELASFFSDGYDVYRAGSADFDIRDYDRVQAVFEDIRPELVLHSAAMVNVDRCETERETAMAVNADGPENIARACKESGARMVYYSTDYVFDGRSERPYIESDPTGPVNFYGVSKLEGENRVRAVLDDFVILRVAWLYSASPKSFINRLIESGTKQLSGKKKGRPIKPIKVVADQVGTPTSAFDVARQTAVVLESGLSGLFHCTAGGGSSRYDLAKFIFGHLGMDVDLTPCFAKDFNWRAPRPLYTVLENRKLDESGLNVMPDHREAIRTFVNNIRRHK